MESIGKDHGGHADTAEITERINIGNAAARFRGGRRTLSRPIMEMALKIFNPKYKAPL